MYKKFLWTFKISFFFYIATYGFAGVGPGAASPGPLDDRPDLESGLTSVKTPGAVRAVPPGRLLGGGGEFDPLKYEIITSPYGFASSISVFRPRTIITEADRDKIVGAGCGLGGILLFGLEGVFIYGVMNSGWPLILPFINGAVGCCMCASSVYCCYKGCTT